MKHYLDLVPISARLHRRQNRMSVFCIILSVFLVTAIFGMADMYIRAQVRQAQMDGGNYHIGISDITDEEAYLISRRPDVQSAARYGVLNYRDQVEYRFSGKKAIIVGCDEAFVTDMQLDAVIEGHFPESGSEVMLTVSARDTLGLGIGDPVEIERPGDSPLSCTVSGFCKNTSLTMSEDSYGLFITTDAFRAIYPVPEGKAFTGTLADYNTALFLLFSDARHAQRSIDNLKQDCRLSDEQVLENTTLLGLMGQSRNSFMMQIYAVAGILFVLVMLSGIMMIASSLSSNVAGRTKFFGLMRCLGATPKQVIRFVHREALTWCRLAIPAGVGAGILVIWVLCAVLRVSSPKYFGALPAFGISVPSIAAGVCMGILTVLLAARTPAKRAAKVSPLSAVSGNAGGLYPVRRAANTKLFHIETALGIHHAAAGRKNFVLMVLSFSLSVILFLSFSVAVAFIGHALTPLRPWTPDLSVISPDNSCSVSRTLFENLRENPAVKAVYGRMFAYNMPVTVNGASRTADLISYEEHQFGWADKYLLEGSTSAAQEKAGTALTVYNTEGTAPAVGDRVQFSVNGETVTVEIVGMLSECPFDSAANVDTLICSEDTFRSITGASDYTILDIQLTGKAADADVEAIHKNVDAALIFSDERMDNESVRGAFYCMWLFLYGFLVLIALITIFNIVNSIALSVAARTGQYGTLRAIGLSMRQLSRMIIAEALTYALSGAVAGTVTGLFLHKKLFEMIISFRWGDAWTVPWSQLGIILLIMALSVISAVYMPIRKLRHMSIVENIGAQ